jgi:NDP-sugar pyrophosphorylase family protein
MINIVIPLAGNHRFFSESEYIYPKPLIEINAITMIEHAINSYNTLKEKKQFIFIVNHSDCKRYHLNNVLKLLTNDECKIIEIEKTTQGSACSVLLAIEEINNDTPLIIANGDQVFHSNLGEHISSFQNNDAGVIVFNSIHPRWSHIKTDTNNNVIEVSEKRPISNLAIAGLFFFKKGEDFVKSAMSMIKKDNNVEGNYYISPTLNEMILENKKIAISTIENQSYHTFYSPEKINEYKENIKRERAEQK